MTVAELIAALREVPPDVPVMIPAESGIDHALDVRVVEVAKHRRDWEGTPVGRYVELPDPNGTGQPFKAVLLTFGPPYDFTWLDEGPEGLQP